MKYGALIIATLILIYIAKKEANPSIDFNAGIKGMQIAFPGNEK